MALNITGTNRNQRRISRTGVDGTTSIHSGTSGTSGTSNPDLSIIRVTIDAPPCGIIWTSSALPSGGLCSPRIGNVWQSTSKFFRKSDGLKAAVGRNFFSDLIALPSSTQVFGHELSNSSSRYLYTLCRANLATESFDPVEPTFVNHGIYDVITLNKNAGIWIPSTRIRRSQDTTNRRAADHNVGQGSAVGDAVGNKSDYSKENYETNF